MKLDFEVTEWEDNKKLAFKMINGNYPKKFNQKWILRPTSTGSRFTFKEEFEFPDPLGKTKGTLARPMVKSIVKKMQTRLKDLAERH